MTDSPKLHQEVLDLVRKEFKDIFDKSGQAICVYVCERHKLCNKKFSSMLGYSSPEEWAKAEAVLSDAKESDQRIIISAYRNAMEKKIGSSFNVTWKNRKNGKIIKTNVILVPLSYNGEIFAIHFITKI